MVILKRVMLDDIEALKLQYPGSYISSKENTGFYIIEIPVVKGRFE